MRSCAAKRHPCEHAPRLRRGSETLSARVEAVRSAVIDGNTLFYLSFEGEEGWYNHQRRRLPGGRRAQPGDRVTVTFTPGEEVLTPLATLELE